MHVHSNMSWILENDILPKKAPKRTEYIPVDTLVILPHSHYGLCQYSQRCRLEMHILWDPDTLCSPHKRPNLRRYTIFSTRLMCTCVWNFVHVINLNQNGNLITTYEDAQEISHESPCFLFVQEAKLFEFAMRFSAGVSHGRRQVKEGLWESQDHLALLYST